MSEKPLVAVTTSRRTGWRTFPFFALNIWKAGGKAVRWTSARKRDIADVDALVVGGGDDISPDFYGGEIVTTARLDLARDELEHDLVDAAARRGIPVLGVCRGAQMINVAMGGSLEQDAYGTFTRSDLHWTVLPRKTVSVIPGSHLADVVGEDPMTVNALHRQSVKSIGTGLEVAAVDGGGMVQAIESSADTYLLGVQWHPEYLFYTPRQRAIFADLIEAAKQASADEDG